MEKDQSKKKIILLATIVIVVIGLLVALYWFTKPSTEVGSKTITVTVIGNDTEQSYTYQTDAEYLGDVLKAETLIKGEPGPYGLFITEVDGIIADDTKQQWWCLTKENQQVNTSADATTISNGDKFELTLKTGW